MLDYQRVQSVKTRSENHCLRARGDSFADFAECPTSPGRTTPCSRIASPDVPPGKMMGSVTFLVQKSEVSAGNQVNEGQFSI